MATTLLGFKEDPEHCVSCGEPYTYKDIDGGRCSCGVMIVADEPYDKLSPVWHTGDTRFPAPPVSHDTEAEAVAWIDEQSKSDPEGVNAGHYYIDGPRS